MNIQPENLFLYDGSFDGFLTCVFEVYNQRLNQVDIQKIDCVQNTLFANAENILTDSEKADRVWKGLKNKISDSGTSRVYNAFLSEKEKTENLLLRFIQYAMKSTTSIENDFANEDVLKVSQIAKSVGREKHRMEAFVRFRLTKDAIYFANIEPDFNVLPLISKHFQRRFADQKWIIYDLKRKYGFFYDLEKVDIIELELPENFDPTITNRDFFLDEELEFQSLWQDYFSSTNIPSRKNLKLHIQHVPKRYWKYLSEKQP